MVACVPAMSCFCAPPAASATASAFATSMPCGTRPSPDILPPGWTPEAVGRTSRASSSVPRTMVRSGLQLVPSLHQLWCPPSRAGPRSWAYSLCGNLSTGRDDARQRWGRAGQARADAHGAWNRAAGQRVGAVLCVRRRSVRVRGTARLRAGAGTITAFHRLSQQTDPKHHQFPVPFLLAAFSPTYPLAYLLRVRLRSVRHALARTYARSLSLSLSLSFSLSLSLSHANRCLGKKNLTTGGS